MLVAETIRYIQGKELFSNAIENLEGLQDIITENRRQICLFYMLTHYERRLKMTGIFSMQPK